MKLSKKIIVSISSVLSLSIIPLSVISCTFFSVNQNAQSNNSNNNNSPISSTNSINYASISSLENLYNSSLNSIESAYSSNFQNSLSNQTTKWVDYNINPYIQLNNEWTNWITINKSNNANYLATLYPQLWSLNNAIAQNIFYWVNWQLLSFLNYLKINNITLKYLPHPNENISYLQVLQNANLSLLDYSDLSIHLKDYLSTQKITYTTWNEYLESYKGDWTPLNSLSITNSTFNYSLFKNGCIAFNVVMMSTQVPSSLTTAKVNYWNYFNNNTFAKQDLQDTISQYQTNINLYNSVIYHLIIKLKIKNT